MKNTMSICPKCGALNNVNIDKALKKDASCGKCGANLKMHTLVSDVSGDDLMRIIAKTDKPVIVDFWASWCGPCQMYGPQFEKASAENTHAIFLKVNTETQPEISQKLGIRGIPATVIFKNGKEINRVSGVISTNEIKKILA